jgi:hypothetical protein
MSVPCLICQIIFALIERAQFALNRIVYAKGDDGVFSRKAALAGRVSPEMLRGKEQDSYLNFMLRETERLHGMVGRYTYASTLATKLCSH